MLLFQYGYRIYSSAQIDGDGMIDATDRTHLVETMKGLE